MKRTIVLILAVALALSMLTIPAMAADDITGVWNGTFTGKIATEKVKGTAGAIMDGSDSTILLTVSHDVLGDFTLNGTYALEGNTIKVTADDGTVYALKYKLKGNNLTLTGELNYMGLLTVTDLKVSLELLFLGTTEIVLPKEGLYEVSDNLYEAPKGVKLQFEEETSEDMSEAKITWKSSKAKVASIKLGLLNPKKAGETKITLKAKLGKNFADDDVTIRVVDLTLNKKKATIYMVPGGKKRPGEIQLTATAKPKTASAAVSTVIWKSSDETVATVVDGLVKPLKVGSATVTVENQYGQTAACEITVK